MKELINALLTSVAGWIVFAFVFLVLAVAINALVYTSNKTIWLLFSVIPGPTAAWCGARLGLAMLRRKNLPSVLVCLLPLACLSFAGGFLPSLVHGVLSAKLQTFAVFSALTIFQMMLACWVLSGVALFLSYRKTRGREV